MRITVSCLLLILGFGLPGCAIAQMGPSLNKDKGSSPFSTTELQRYEMESRQVTIIRDRNEREKKSGPGWTGPLYASQFLR